ncbi:MAG: endonuclease III domain-containing protein [Candidatus Omnitrophica bacterium]|jgi:endonuclease-3 related protein|nr:endonuclease III domain-containing protein [Candidatus Omnitrophota bacterium]MDD3274389.1 endonuclease III domain-containing protein [Candidatus Omnitrophota bacterium]MDD5077444.1 endonuclease III domain-containing protein [Candidatus Omnitrophota bacterium]MDD5724880.1 endonuclease III domain-containing protein [Candidatus Omnitrophota bacterium]
MKGKIKLIYRRLYSAFGPQGWWPAQSAFEVIVGAILTQNTSWSNVEKAIISLKKKKLLDPVRLYRFPRKKLAALIKSAGYYNIKALRIRNFLAFFFRSYQGKIERMRKQEAGLLRKELLAVNGIGPETADSILLYALDKPVFVIDAYTRRILLRHGLSGEDDDYARLQDVFMRGLKKDKGIFNEYHALLVKTGKEYCRKNNPKCKVCPLWPIKNVS